jgi:hypothetical protein
MVSLGVRSERGAGNSIAWFSGDKRAFFSCAGNFLSSFFKWAAAALNRCGKPLQRNSHRTYRPFLWNCLAYASLSYQA